MDNNSVAFMAVNDTAVAQSLFGEGLYKSLRSTVHRHANGDIILAADSVLSQLF
jgi:hypothetical protein